MYNQVPLEVYSTWPSANTKNPESRASILIGFEVVMMVIVTVAVLTRWFSRTCVSRSVGPDDWIIMPAAIFALAQCIVGCIGVKFGWGIHAWDFMAIYVDKSEESYKLVLAATVLFGLANTFTKLSILYFYKRICITPIISKIVSITIYVVIVWGLVVFWIGIFQCRPTSAFWSTYTPPNAQCISETFSEIYAATDIFLNMWILCLPLRTLLKLQMPLQKRLQLVALLSLGGLSCIAGIMRLPSTLNSMTTYDASWEGPILEMWSSLELAVGIACSCAPATSDYFITRKDNKHNISLKSSPLTSAKKSFSWKKPEHAEKTMSVMTTRSVAAFPEPEEYAYIRQVRHSKAKSEIRPGPLIELQSAFPSHEEAMQFWKNPEACERYFKRLHDIEQGCPDFIPVTPRAAAMLGTNTTARRASLS